MNINNHFLFLHFLRFYTVKWYIINVYPFEYLYYAYIMCKFTLYPHFTLKKMYISTFELYYINKYIIIHC